MSKEYDAIKMIAEVGGYVGHFLGVSVNRLLPLCTTCPSFFHSITKIHEITVFKLTRLQGLELNTVSLFNCFSSPNSKVSILHFTLSAIFTQVIT